MNDKKELIDKIDIVDMFLLLEQTTDLKTKLTDFAINTYPLNDDICKQLLSTGCLNFLRRQLLP